MQAAAGIQQDGIRRGTFARRHIGQADAAGVAQAFQPAGGEHRHRDIAHAHQAGNTLGAVGQRGGDGALALVGAGAHDAVAVDGGDVLIAGAPVDGLAALFLRRLVGQQRRAGVFGVQVQLQLAGIVDEGRVGRFALAAGQAGDGEGPHDEVDVHRLALHAVVGAGGGVAALPHIVGAGVAQFVGEPRDPEVVAPGVERRVAETGAHPVQRGVDALFAGVAVLGQAVKERLGNGGHLLGEDIADARVLEVVVDRVRKLVGRGGIVLEPFLRGRDEAQQAGDVVGLGAGFLLIGGVGVQVHPERDAQPRAFVGVAPPLVVVLGPAFLLAVPLAAETAADDGKVDAGGLGFLPVDFALVFGHVDALEHGGGHGLAAGVKVVTEFVFLPGGSHGAVVRLRRAGRPCRAPHERHGGRDDHHKAQDAQRQHQNT